MHIMNVIKLIGNMFDGWEAEGGRFLVYVLWKCQGVIHKLCNKCTAQNPLPEVAGEDGGRVTQSALEYDPREIPDSLSRSSDSSPMRCEPS